MLLNLLLSALFYSLPPKYALSDEFVIDNQGNELYNVLQILKQLSRQ
jgi:hypothetical protein